MPGKLCLIVCGKWAVKKDEQESRIRSKEPAPVQIPVKATPLFFMNVLNDTDLSEPNGNDLHNLRRKTNGICPKHLNSCFCVGKFIGKQRAAVELDHIVIDDGKHRNKQAASRRSTPVTLQKH